jgi:hypothetical protein
MALRGPQLSAAVDAFVDAFPTQKRLEQMLEFRLEKQLGEIASPGNLREVLFELFQAANAEGWELSLVIAARASNPGNAKLTALAQQLGTAPATGPTFEAWVRRTNAIVDLPGWLHRLGEIEARVCRIEIGAGEGYGTGFLIAKDLVLTNQHVVAGRAPGQIAARFDFRRLGSEVMPGTAFPVTEIVDASPPGEHDLEAEPPAPPDPSSQLDHAVLRLAQPAGELPIGARPEPTAPARGWLSPHAEPLAAGTPLFIVQHPRAEPISLALDTDGVIGVNANQTRVRYRTNTEPGSSGSPCFDQHWNLVALHHLGDPSWQGARFNQGVVIAAVAARLRGRGIDWPDAAA